MSFRFFRPWEDGGQGNTGQTPDRCQKTPSEPSKTTTPPQVLHVQAEQRGLPSKATRSGQVLPDIPGALCLEEETHRTEKEDVRHASHLDTRSMENSLVSLDRVLRQTSASGSSKNAGSASEDSACTNNESENYALHNISQVWKSSCQFDKHRCVAYKTHSSIVSSHFTSIVASQNDPSLQVASTDVSLIPGDDLCTLNPSARSGSCVAENDVQSKATPDVSADVAKSRLDVNHSKFAADSSKVEKQYLQCPSTTLKEECCVDTFSDARQEHHQTESKLFQCKICGKSFTQSGNMHRHEKIHTESRLFQCIFCKEIFSCLDNLQTHKAIHAKSKPYQCILCDKAFSNSSNFRVHERFHSGYKPFKCSVCEKTFANSSNLHVHERIHTGSKPFKCTVCKKAFTHSSSLHRHERIHTGSKPFKCSVCEKAFTQSSHLFEHERIHTGSKPLKCSVCEKAFKRYDVLQAHKRIHTGSKPFRCLVCEKAFAHKSNMHRHKRIHTGSKPFKCTFCEKAFAQSNTLHRHERLHRIQTILM